MLPTASQAKSDSRPQDVSDLAQRVWFRLIRLERRVQGAMAERFRKAGLSVPQGDVLMTLTEQEGVSQQELATRLYVTKGNISGLVDRLVAAGFVERRVAAADRRSHSVHLTPAGRQAAMLAFSIQNEFVMKTLARMPVRELEDFDRLIVTFRDIVREQNES